VLEELGHGGMGIVYRARQVGLDRVVALKMLLLGAAAGPEDLARFRREAEAIARLRHPNVVQIYQVGEHNGLPYFSLEFCAGGSLARQTGGRPQPVLRAAELVATLARAVQAAHEAGVVHRDLKPGNVLLDADGTPKITDFGLAKKLDGAGGLTQTGVVLGTPSYVAPEACSGAKDVGPAADVWALGAILYELLTGRPPFRGATALDTLMQVVSEAPVPPSRLRPGIPPALEAICLRCLEKDPGRRPASAAALAEELERFRAGGMRGPEHQPSPFGPRALLTAAGIVLLCAVVAEAFTPTDRPTVQGVLGIVGLIAAGVLGFLGLRSWVRQLPPSGRRLRALAFSPDGRTLAVGSVDGSLRLWDLGTEEVRLLAGSRRAVRALAFVTQHGRPCLAVLDWAGVLTYWDLPSGPQRVAPRVALRTGECVTAAAFSACGRWLAAGVGPWWLLPLWEPPRRRLAGRKPRQVLHVWDLAAGKELNTPAELLPLVWEMNFAADASGLTAETSAGTKCWTIDRARGRVEERSLPASDDRLRATRNADGTVSLQAATGEELARLAVEAPPTVTVVPAGGARPAGPGDRRILLLAFSPDRRTLALADDRGGVAWCDVAQVSRPGRSGAGGGTGTAPRVRDAPPGA
jgi:hypothetical protein